MQLDACLAYLRDRVGVPRDMPAPAAAALRAHLNWAIAMCRAPARPVDPRLGVAQYNARETR